MSITRVTTAKAGSAGSASVLTTSAFNAVSGNTLIVLLRTSGPTVSSITDTAGNIFLPLDTAQAGQDAGLLAYACFNCSGNATNVVTVNWSTTVFGWVYVAQYSGLLPCPSLDAHASLKITPTSVPARIVTPNISTVQNNELILTAVTTNQLFAYTVDSPFTLLDGSINAGVSLFGAVAELITTVSVVGLTCGFEAGGTYSFNGALAISLIGAPAASISEIFSYIPAKPSTQIADVFQQGETFPVLLPSSATGVSGTVYIDTGAIRSASTISGSDTAQYVDSNSARSKTTLSGVDTEQATDANSIRSASRVSAVDTAQFVDTGTIRSHATPTGTDTQSDIDTSSIHSVSRLAISDTAQFVDSGTIRSKITPAVADTKQAVDTGAIRSASRVTGLDTAQYVDSGAIRCKSTAGGSEGSGGTESGTVKSTSRISITELIIRGDSATLVSVSRVAGVDVAIFVDAATLRTTARLVIADQRVVLEVGTIRSITAFSGIEFSAPPIPVVDLLAFMYARWMGSIEQRQYEGNFYSRWSGVCKSIRSVLSSISL